jgi:signal transduction histidine kinase
VSRDRAESLAGVALALASAAAAAALGSSLATVVAAAVLGAAVGLGRRHPRTAWLLGAGAVLALAPDERSSVVPFFLVPVLAFCAGRWDSRWGGLAGVAALIGASEIGVWVTHDSGVPAFLIPAAAWAAARALAEREQVAAQLAERVRELEQEREAHARLSVRYERARIASELHDIVAHAISVMVVQATAGQRLAARDPEATARTFEAISGAAQQAEEDMGRLVALLGDEDAIGRAPDLVLVEELVARAAGSGLDVTLRLEGEREGLPAPVVEAAYRVVQEGLTNALRYAAGASVQAVVRGDRRGLLVQVTNGPASEDAALAGVGTGNGIQGLRERVGGCGGTLEAGPTPEDGWRLRARLPRRVQAASAS